MSRLHTENEQSASHNRWVFTWAHSKTFTAREVFNGRLGDLPLLMVVSSGFSRTHCGPGVHHMQHFETGEVLFAFQRAFHRRVLLHDSRDRTLSLPQLSPILFKVKDPLNEGEEKVLTASEVVKTMTLPVSLSFHQKEDLLFVVDRDFKDYQFFGDLTLVSVYLEPFLCCLSVGNEDGKVTNNVVAIPCRLRRARMSQVDGVTGQSDRGDTLNGLLRTYLEAARNVSPRQDPFCKELAFISRKTKITMETDIPDYIGDDTFIDSTYRRPRQRQPGAEADCEAYESLQPVDRASHYDVVIELDAQREDFAKGSSAGELRNSNSQPVRSGSGLDIHTPLAEPLAALPPPLPCRPQVAKDVTQSSSGKPPAQPHCLPVTRPLRSTGTESPGGVTPTLSKPLADVSPNFPHKDQSLSKSSKSLQDRSKQINIEQLSVNDVCKCLRALALEKHCKKFKESLIDGKILKKLSRRVLEKEFNLSEVEIVKLSTFIEEGHIPR